MNQDLDARLGVVELRLDREPSLVHAATPVVAGDGQQVGIAKQRNKWLQTNILKDLCAESFKKRRAASETALGGHKASLQKRGELQLCEMATFMEETIFEKMVEMPPAIGGNVATPATATKPAKSAYSMRS